MSGGGEGGVSSGGGDRPQRKRGTSGCYVSFDKDMMRWYFGSSWAFGPSSTLKFVNDY